MAKKESATLVKNPKAYHDYEVTETYEVGMVLKGTEIKSLREHQGSLKEAYVKIIRNELWLVGAHIPSYRFGNIHNHEELRDRKLLMHAREIYKLKAETKEKGMALIPIKIYLKQGKAKMQLGLGRGKKKHDKREALKERDADKHMRQAMKRN